MSKKILVVDDEEDIRTYLSSLLTDHGYVTCEAGDGFSALNVARSENPDLITLDLIMPNKTGTDFYRRLSRDRELSGIPVIVISGVAGRELAVRKPAAVFDKPIDPDEFLDEVRKALR